VERPDARELLYEGKAKQVFATDDPDLVIVHFKDDATAFNAEKRGTVVGKGEVNNAVTALLYPELEAFGVPTHFLQRLSERDQLVRRVRIVPVEVIVRNRAAGTFAKRYGVEEGRPLDPTVIEFCLKSDALGDPPMNVATAVALGHATEEQIEALFEMSAAVNDYLLARFAVADLDLVDFKLEFGVDADGELLLADEISPDTCRLWDAATGEKLDKDRFRRDLGGVEEAYLEVRRRLEATVGVEPDLDFGDDEDGHDHDDHDHEGHAHHHGHHHAAPRSGSEDADA
jgi:phosphoribosylaminoimidazole-succinocarboxamide synthase